MDEIIDLVGDDAGADADVVDIAEDGAAETLPRTARRNSDGSVSLRLQVPVTLTFRSAGETREEVFDSLTMRRLKGADLIAVQGAEAEQRAYVMLSRSAGISLGKMKPVFERMDASDASAAMQVIACFLESGPTTGR